MKGVVEMGDEERRCRGLLYICGAGNFEFRTHNREFLSLFGVLGFPRSSGASAKLVSFEGLCRVRNGGGGPRFAMATGDLPSCD